MTPEQAAQLTIAVYLLLGAALIAMDSFRSRQSASVWFLYALQRLYSGLLFHWRSNRRCPFPAVGPALILANHRSPVDPMMIWTNHHLTPGGRGPIRVIGFLMAREYYQIPGLNWLCRTMQSIPADRNGRDIGPVKAALSRLKSGEMVGIFPEGRLNKGTGLLPFGSGIAWLALKTDAPIYPVFIHGSPQRRNMILPFLTPSRVRVTYGDPIDLSPWRAREREAGTLEEVTRLLRRRLAALGNIPLDDADHPAGSSRARARERAQGSETLSR